MTQVWTELPSWVGQLLATGAGVAIADFLGLIYFFTHEEPVKGYAFRGFVRNLLNHVVGVLARSILGLGLVSLGYSVWNRLVGPIVPGPLGHMAVGILLTLPFLFVDHGAIRRLTEENARKFVPVLRVLAALGFMVRSGFMKGVQHMRQEDNTLLQRQKGAWDFGLSTREARLRMRKLWEASKIEIANDRSDPELSKWKLEAPYSRFYLLVGRFGRRRLMAIIRGEQYPDYDFGGWDGSSRRRADAGRDQRREPSHPQRCRAYDR